MKTVAVVGGGAAGLMAAYAASLTSRVILLEKNEKLGKKIYITGKGRCNVTNDCDVREFLSNVVTNPKFLMGAINTFGPEDLMALIECNGVNLKVERGNRVFPASDKASDVTRCLERMLNSNGVSIRLNSEVEQILVEDGRACGVKLAQEIVPCDAVIICTGGVSYPVTGSTGDGYKFAKSCGHTVIPPRSALTGINLDGNEFASMQGLSLKNIRLTVNEGNKEIFSQFGEMLFTHFGVSGPVVLSASSAINKRELSKLVLSIDLKPALSEEELDNRILKDFSLYKNKDFCNSLGDLLPKAMIDPVIKRSGIDPYKKVNSITAEERKRLLSVLKNFTYRVRSLRPIEEGIVTSGGVNVKEINPKTMESKLVKGLYFAGEVIDVDAYTGGFNLQIAFSTAYSAGIYAGEE